MNRRNRHLVEAAAAAGTAVVVRKWLRQHRPDLPAEVVWLAGSAAGTVASVAIVWLFEQ